MNKLNFGCGTRYSPKWVNIDVYSSGPEVRRVNLLKRWPFADASFEAAYSSHVLEHFTPAQADHLIAESHRVLQPGGILRTVVPDLELSVREYLRALEASGTGKVAKEYPWAVLELIDQLTRSTPSGEMSPYFQQLKESGDRELCAYVESRSGIDVRAEAPARGLGGKVRGLTWKKIYNKLFYGYLHLVSRLFPRHIRSQVMVLTGLGERHRWMYDRVGLPLLLEKHGFGDVKIQQFNTSGIPDFNADGMDMEPDGTPYKRVSLYVEARKK